MPSKMALVRAFAFLSLTTLSCWANPITVGALIYLSPADTPNGLQGFEVLNASGATFGCIAPDTPVCTDLNFTDTALTVVFDSQPTVTHTPSFSFTPGTYIYGLSDPPDDLSQTFLFDPSLVILSATLTGMASPTSFEVIDGAMNESAFTSDGQFSVSLDFSAGPPGFGLITIDASEGAGGTSTVPEPATIYLVAAGLVILRRFQRV